MVLSRRIIGFAACFAFARLASCYDLVREYSGQDFFFGWDFYGFYDNLTDGNVNYLSQADATAQNLAYVNSAGNAIIKVDNTTNVPIGGNRSSVRITSQDYYDIGSVWIIDVDHIPFGCTTWPAIWSFAPGNWPDGGEIDIVEAINTMGNNQMALHTLPGCMKTTPPNQSGFTGPTNCSLGSGCVVSETKPNSWNSGFAQAGGGVFAAQLDVTGIYMWFWSRPDVPASIQSKTNVNLTLSDWGNPSGSWPAVTCNISEYFAPQKLVIDITLCGVWAGVPSIYNQTCGNTGSCANNVAGNGSQFDNAYFEIPSIKAYTVALPSPSASHLPSPSPSVSTHTSSNGAQRSDNMMTSHFWAIIIVNLLYAFIGL